MLYYSEAFNASKNLPLSIASPKLAQARSKLPVWARLKAAEVDTDLSFETVQRTGLDAGLVDNKSASIDEVYQGLQFVVRLKDRTKRTAERPS
jgi:hypothetical protein